MKRFFKQAKLVSYEAAYGVRLDDLELKTPAKNRLAVPSAALGNLLVDEWNNCGDDIDLTQMPLNRLVNAALDRVDKNHDALADGFVAYGNHDLLCYRATHPDALIARQNEIWNPILEWCKTHYGLDFTLTNGIEPIDQPPETLHRLRDIYLSPHNNLRFAGLSQAAALLGSAVLALGLENKHINAAQAYEAAFVDELFQSTQWGADEEAQMRRGVLKEEIAQMAAFFAAL